MIRLYHGSNALIKHIDLAKSKPNKDFGKAFYLSESYRQAEEMSAFTVERLGGLSFVTEFEFDENLLQDNSLNIKIFRDYSKEWADFIFANRNTASMSNIHDFDIIYGPIANDRVGRQIFNYKEGYIDTEEFMNRLKNMKGITFQYTFLLKKLSKNYREYERHAKRL